MNKMITRFVLTEKHTIISEHKIKLRRLLIRKKEFELNNDLKSFKRLENMVGIRAGKIMDAEQNMYKNELIIDFGHTIFEIVRYN